MPVVLWWEDVWILFMCTQQITLEMRLLWVCCLLGLFVRVSVFNLMRGIRSPTSFFRKDGGYNDTKYHPVLAQSQIISVLIPCRTGEGTTLSARLPSAASAEPSRGQPEVSCCSIKVQTKEMLFTNHWQQGWHKGLSLVIGLKKISYQLFL